MPVAMQRVPDPGNKVGNLRCVPRGLVPIHDVPIYGRIAAMQLFRPKECTRDLLFLTTEKYSFCVLEYNDGQIITRANGEVRDRIGRPADVGQIGVIDPSNRMIGLHLYDGLFKVIPMNPTNGDLKEAFNIRLEELQVLDIQFLHGVARPTIAVLYQDNKEKRHIKTYEVLVEEKEFGEGPFVSPDVDPSSSIIEAVPEPLGGVVLVGENFLSYHGAHSPPRVIAIQSTIMRTCGRIDNSRYLLGDHMGKLYVLVLGQEDNKVASLSIEELGVTSVSSTLSYLDNGVVFVGSTYGDSQLIKLNEKTGENGFIGEIERFMNLGPIVDFCVMDLERQGQGQVVTCSGAFKDGSLRIIRNGIGINESALIELPGLKGIWPLKSSTEDKYDKYLVISFITETRFLTIEEEFEEAEIEGFEGDQQTLQCANVAHNQLLQITEESVRLVDASSLKLVSEWKPKEGKISVATSNKTQILAAVRGGKLYYLEIEKANIKDVSNTTLEHEIACLDVTPIGDDADRSGMCAVGMWTDITLRVLTLDTLEEVVREPLGGEVVPRSVMFSSFEEEKYLLCTLGDGHLFNFRFHMDEGKISNRKKIALATQPITLETFTVNEENHVFACSDRPTVIYCNNKKLMYSNVNLHEVTAMCTFNTEVFPDSLCLVSEDSLTIGTIDDIQKLHIRSVPLNEMPRRIAQEPASNTLAVLTINFGSEEEEKETGFVRLFDDQTFEVIDSFQLADYENGCSLITCEFEDDPQPYYIVGTAFADPEYPEPVRGRIIAFKAEENKLVKVAEEEVEGAVYCLNAFNGRLLAGVNSRVILFEWTSEERTGAKKLVQLSQHLGHILALFLRSRGDFIVVADLMKSIMLLSFNSMEGKLEEIARDYNPNWMTAVEILDDDTFIGAENSYNLFTVQKNSEAASDEDRGRLEIVGEMGLGEFVNRFRNGSLVMKMPEPEGLNLPTTLFGTVGGSVGVIATLPEDKFEFLSTLQERMTAVIKGVGGFEHAHWRAFTNERKTVEMSGFIDGDLIESFVDLPRDQMEEIVSGMDKDVEEVTRFIETLTQAVH